MHKHHPTQTSANETKATKSKPATTPAQLGLAIEWRLAQRRDEQILTDIESLRKILASRTARMDGQDKILEDAISRHEKLREANLERPFLRGPLSKMLGSRLSGSGALTFAIIRTGLLCLAKTMAFDADMAFAVSQIQQEEGYQDFIEEIDPELAKAFAEEFMQCIRLAKKGLKSEGAMTSKALLALLCKVVREIKGYPSTLAGAPKAKEEVCAKDAFLQASVIEDFLRENQKNDADGGPHYKRRFEVAEGLSEGLVRLKSIGETSQQKSLSRQTESV